MLGVCRYQIYKGRTGRTAQFSCESDVKLTFKQINYLLILTCILSGIPLGARRPDNVGSLKGLGSGLACIPRSGASSAAQQRRTRARTRRYTGGHPKVESGVYGLG